MTAPPRPVSYIAPFLLELCHLELVGVLLVLAAGLFALVSKDFCMHFLLVQLLSAEEMKQPTALGLCCECLLVLPLLLVSQGLVIRGESTENMSDLD